MNALLAKQDSEAWIAAAGVAINHDLPCFDEPSALTIREPREVAIRAWVMAHVVYLGYGNTGEQMLSLLRGARLDEYLTPNELSVCTSATLSDEQKAWAAWLCEAVHGCAWALRMVETEPLDDCPNTLAHMFPVATDPWPSIEAASLRGHEKIYQRADTMYRLHWAAVDARFSGRAMPVPEPAILMRRHSLEWIVGAPQDWDEVPLDT
jgi:Domain of unknown function (DUF4272)